MEISESRATDWVGDGYNGQWWYPEIILTCLLRQASMKLSLVDSPLQPRSPSLSIGKVLLWVDYEHPL